MNPDLYKIRTISTSNDTVLTTKIIRVTKT